MVRGIVLGAGDPGLPTRYELALGDATVTVEARGYDPVTEETLRARLSRAALAAEESAELLDLLAPGAAAALERLQGETIEATAHLWLAAMLGREVVDDWAGVLDPDGAPVPFTVESWQLACFTVPRFARAFLEAWLRPRTAEIAAGNA